MEDVYKYLINKIKNNDIVVASISGGPDSMALLHILITLKKEKNYKLICCHINHNTGRIGQLEEQHFVEQYCKDNNIICETMTIDTYNENNFENEARKKRYEFLENIINKYKAKYLLTAHHGDDLIETILMRLTRGSTLKGYSGFSKITNKDNYQIIRPFIELTKEDLIKYNEKNNIKYYIDKTNLEDNHTRNRYRKYILPKLKQENKNVHKKFYKFSNILQEYEEYIDSQVEKIIPDIYQENKLNLEQFNKLEHLIQVKIIYYILECIYKNDIILITDKHIELIYKLINSNKANTYINFPNKLKIKKTYKILTFKKEDKLINNYKYEINKDINLPNGHNIEILDNSNQTDNYICRINKDDVVLPLYVRTRQNGDKMLVKNLKGHKKINDIFTDKKINLSERDTWPIVVYSNNTIIWLPGLKKSQFDKQNTQKYDIILRYY